MISVDEAVGRVVAAFRPLESESVAIGKADGRVLAADAVATFSQPPFPVSAMDGYAVRAADVAKAPIRLRVIGSAPAGHPFAGTLGAGEAVRVFTGGVVPDGADAIVIQEDTDLGIDVVTVAAPARPGKHIRAAGLDFKAGDVLAAAGKRLSARDLSLLAAADLPTVEVRRKPRVVLAATGDELTHPGEPRKPGGIVASSVYGLSALIGRWGGEVRDLGILPDREDSIAEVAAQAGEADLIVTLGGASVGDHDLVQKALGPKGFALDFWKITMRPGKPLIFGRLGATPLLGLPGNPVSAFVCAILFVKPAIETMLGLPLQVSTSVARLSAPLGANDGRQDYLRARLQHRDGQLWVEAFATQDSSMQKVLAEADALILRAPNAPPAHSGESVEVIGLQDF
jgi:molybdopterin molybdotransferase